MNELTAIGTAATVPAENFSLSMIDSFISYIDRGEKTTKTYFTNLRQFIAWLKYEQISRPTRQDIISYRQYLTEEHPAIRLDPASAQGWAYRTDAAGQPIRVKCRPNTIALYLRSVCQLFSWAAANGLYPNIAQGIHAPKIRQDTHRKEALPASAVLTIEQSINRQAQGKAAEAEAAAKDATGRTQRATEQGKRLYAMFLLAVNAGLRTIEISRANIRDIETINGTAVMFVWGKGHTEPDTKKILAPEVKAAIDDYLAARTDHKTGSSPLFVSTGNRSGGKRIAETTISRQLKKAMQQAGFDSERITAHSLRHTAGTNVQELTGNIYLTQQYMRHSTPQTTEIYLHCDTERQEAGIAQQLYNRYHNISGAADQRQQLETILQKMNPEQLAQLAGIAAAIAR